MKKASIFILFLWCITACTPIVVNSSYDSGKPFGDYESFIWMDGIDQEFANAETYVNEEVKNRIMRQTLKEMILKGYRLDPGQAEVAVNIEVITPGNKGLDNSKEAGYTYWSGYEPANLPFGALVIELIDKGRKQVIWQGVARDALPEKPGRRLNRVDEAVHLIFERYENRIF
ncbi:MAG: DUF4136 domain-containing protein [Candidatus Cyclobacteriaceae bacterium M3_2C_046]